VRITTKTHAYIYTLTFQNIITAVLLTLIPSSDGAIPSTCFSNYAVKIVGGVQATPREFPFQVRNYVQTEKMVGNIITIFFT
jgi:hypothetical protein